MSTSWLHVRFGAATAKLAMMRARMDFMARILWRARFKGLSFFAVVSGQPHVHGVCWVPIEAGPDTQAGSEVSFIFG